MTVHVYTDPFQHALDAAELRLSEVEKQFASLTSERERLQAVVSSLRLLVSPSEAINEAATVPDPTSPQSIEAKPKMRRGPSDTASWRVTREIFTSTQNQPLSVPEIGKRLNDKGFAFDHRAIRSGMARKEDVFEQVGYGKWRLKMSGEIRKGATEPEQVQGSESLGEQQPVFQPQTGAEAIRHRLEMRV